MEIFLNILTGIICFLTGFYYGIWFIRRKYLEVSKKLLLVLDSDIYNLDFLTGAGVTLNTVFENKLNCDVKLALTRKILDNSKTKERSKYHE